MPEKEIINFLKKQNENKNKKALWAGFEPTRAEPKRFQVVLLNHSDITA